MFSGSPFFKSGATLSNFSHFHFSKKIPFSSDRLNKCFTGLLISTKHFLTTFKFIWSYTEFSFIFDKKKASFNALIDKAKKSSLVSRNRPGEKFFITHPPA